MSAEACPVELQRKFLGNPHSLETRGLLGFSNRTRADIVVEPFKASRGIGQDHRKS
jgi:hypothetical protein